MKTFKTLFLLVLIISFSFTSCEENEKTNEPTVSTEEQIAQFEESLKSDTDPRGPSEIDCAFGGVIDAKGITSSGHFVGVNEFPFLFGDDAEVTWSIDGEVVTPLRPRFVRLEDHLSQPAKVEVCFSVTSSTCGTISDCIITDFEL
ncbi:hypothetical protein NBT05_09165 [Aquimarina sp. ERC-38]|uniref:hypothetical protein n=1 Tax=Aquimarina sp. ERC-38 TaxID=2949996 RepID=UPI002247EF49|nr:hypothetical protein [Aquimarina sp. ERC-38]UZO79140.1 hypothetical protein NBT05_09165 [Aquimarina sp. ERC-38]